VQSRSVDGRSSSYRYDRIDRLHQESGVASQSFGLDANANRTSDAQATYTILANGNRQVTRSGVTLTYDAAGQLLSDQTRLAGSTVNRSFTYTLSGALRTVSVGGLLRATYVYNHLEQRTRKTLAAPPPGTPATTLYRYDTQGHLVEELAGSAASAAGISVTAGQTLVTYVWKDDSPSAIIYAPNSPANPGNALERIVYLHTDHLGTPRKATDAQARVVWYWESDAFGSSAPNEDPDGDGSRTTINLRFPGQYFDQESGLHYNWHRYYDAQTGRYIQSDPIGLAGGINTYAYVENQPTKYVDPDGLQIAIPAPAPAMSLAPWAGPAAGIGLAGYGGWQLGTALYPYIERPLGDAIEWCMNSESARCQKVREKCIDYCTSKTLPTRDYGAAFRKCLNRCMVDNGCKAPSAGGW